MSNERVTKGLLLLEAVRRHELAIPHRLNGLGVWGPVSKVERPATGLHPLTYFRSEKVLVGCRYFWQKEGSN
jgi:hypothetical protein